MAAEGMAQAHMLVMQTTEAEQFAWGNHHLLGEHALKHQAHIHRRRRLQPKTRPGHGHAVMHTPLQTHIQAVTHGVGLLVKALTQRL